MAPKANKIPAPVIPAPAAPPLFFPLPPLTIDFSCVCPTNDSIELIEEHWSGLGGDKRSNTYVDKWKDFDKEKVLAEICRLQKLLRSFWVLNRILRVKVRDRIWDLDPETEPLEVSNLPESLGFVYDGVAAGEGSFSPGLDSSPSDRAPPTTISGSAKRQKTAEFEERESQPSSVQTMGEMESPTVREPPRTEYFAKDSTGSRVPTGEKDSIAPGVPTRGLCLPIALLDSPSKKTPVPGEPPRTEYFAKDSTGSRVPTGEKDSIAPGVPTDSPSKKTPVPGEMFDSFMEYERVRIMTLKKANDKIKSDIEILAAKIVEETKESVRLCSDYEVNKSGAVKLSPDLLLAYETWRLNPLVEFAGVTSIRTFNPVSSNDFVEFQKDWKERISSLEGQLLELRMKLPGLVLEWCDEMAIFKDSQESPRDLNNIVSLSSGVLGRLSRWELEKNAEI
jgi:hypothetical protein